MNYYIFEFFGGEIRLLKLSKIRSKLKVCCGKKIKIEKGIVVDGRIVKPNMLEKILKENCKKVRFKDKAIVQVSSSQIIRKRIDIPKVKKRVREQIFDEFTRDVWGEEHNVIYDYKKVQENKEFEHYQISYVPRDIIQGYYSVFKDVGLNLIKCEDNFNSIENYFQMGELDHVTEKQDGVMIIHSHDEGMNLCYLYKGKLKEARTFWWQNEKKEMILKLIERTLFYFENSSSVNKVLLYDRGMTGIYGMEMIIEIFGERLVRENHILESREESSINDLEEMFAIMGEVKCISHRGLIKSRLVSI